ALIQSGQRLLMEVWTSLA
ncbi:unnamed protein product, partial [Allacma fusca]